jgi:NAD(P)-dependent dehydrogenase (short-subunit alcohol dehydrogenase family)
MARVLITGASRGIGREVAEELTARGHEVIATARDLSSPGDMPAAVRLELDVTDESSVRAAVEAAGPIDVLVSNAGATVRAPMETVPLAEVEKLFNLNTFGALRVAQAVLPGMRQRRFGKLIFVSSIQGRIAIPLIGPYAASKWALEAIAETLAIEVRHFGVSISVLQPGGLFRRRRAGEVVPRRQQSLPSVNGPVGRLPLRSRQRRRGGTGGGRRDR